MFIRPGRTIYSVNVPCLAVAAPDVFKKVFIPGDGARGAPSGAAGTILEPQLLNQRSFDFVQGKGEGIRQLGKRLDPARQVGVQGAAASKPADASPRQWAAMYCAARVLPTCPAFSAVPPGR